MAIPTGPGTEVMKSNRNLAMSDTNVLLIPSPTANHIYTVLSIIFAEEANAAEILYLRLFTNSAMNAGDHWLMRSQAIGGMQTFVWNDRFSFSGVLYLGAMTASAANVDVLTTYIDQDWT
jgi:hypothetical protein